MATIYNLTCSILLIAAFALLTPTNAQMPQYDIYIKTGNASNAGTSANIRINLYNIVGNYFGTGNIVNWGGAMDAGHKYFETGSIDFFSGRGPYTSHQVCKIELFSDGTGNKPDWFVDFVAVSSGSYYTRFYVNQWLSLAVPPYKLSVVRNNCWMTDVAMVV